LSIIGGLAGATTAAFSVRGIPNVGYVNSGFFHPLWSIDFATVGRPREVGGQLKAFFD
jgi:hypothetical protein